MQKVLYTVKYLGIKTDKNLDYKYHINDITVKPKSAYDLLFKIKNVAVLTCQNLFILRFLKLT